jgi:hypothetical protein
MTNTGKMLIIGLLVIDVGVAGYLLFPKDERPPAVTGTVIGSAATTAAGDSRAPESRVAAGSVVRTTPGNDATDKLAAVAPAAPMVKVAPAATVAPVVNAANATKAIDAVNAAPAVPATTVPSAVTAAPAAGTSTSQAANAARPATSPAMASTKVQPPAQSKSKPALRADQARGHKDYPHRGSNQVSAALTAQLVKESAKPDPSLPLPPGGSISGGNSTGRSPNPVASAMTDQLVRESSRVNLSSPAQSYKH